MAENKERTRLTDWLITMLVLAITILLAVELGVNIRDSQEDSRNCISAESTG